MMDGPVVLVGPSGIAVNTLDRQDKLVLCGCATTTERSQSAAELFAAHREVFGQEVEYLSPLMPGGPGPTCCLVRGLDRVAKVLSIPLPYYVQSMSRSIEHGQTIARIG